MSKSACFASALVLGGILAAPAAALNTERYRSLEGTLLVHTTIVGPILTPARVSFYLAEESRGPLFDTYRVVRLRGQLANHTRSFVGTGRYTIGGEVAVTHRLELDLTFDTGGETVHLDSGLVVTRSRFPSIAITATQDPPIPDNTLALELIAIPAYPIWFSTANGFHSNTYNRPISDGDLLSTTGAIVANNFEFTRNLGIMPIVPDIGLDAVVAFVRDAPPRYAFFFSSETPIFSERLGPLGHGDVLSAAGAVIARNSDLLAPFGPPEIAFDFGLDALGSGLHLEPHLLFSVETRFFSATLNKWIETGDLLSDAGQVVRSNRTLLSAVGPLSATADTGLDAVHVWPTDEIWFSTEQDFTTPDFGTIRDGDLLSDAGWVIARNLELVAPFAPAEDVDNFGLDAANPIPFFAGDVNCDAAVNFDDIDGFVTALVGIEAYELGYPACNYFNADVNQDGAVNFDDIDPFIRCLIIGDC